MDRTAWLRATGEVQARLCRENGSPTYAALVDALVDGLGGGPHRDSAAVALLREDAGDPVGTALYLRLLGAVHRMALAEEDCELRAWFPSTGGVVDVERVVPAFFAVVEEHRANVRAGMAAAVQTNEAGRSAPLSAAVNWAVGRLGGPVRLLEIGASAGLNLWLDRYRVVAGPHAWGPADAAVRLDGHFTTPPPPASPYVVVQRRGCDPNPLDATDPATRLLLRSFVWPEDTARLARLDAALHAAEHVAIDRQEASAWLGTMLAALPPDVTTVVFHSIVVQYMSEEERARTAAAIRAAGARGGGRLAWIAMEPTPRYEAVEVRAELWPPGERWRLATTGPHGLDVRWGPQRDDA